MVRGITRNGFQFEVSKDIANDMELLELLEKMIDNNLLVLGKVCKKVLGEDQKKALYEHLRREDGRVPVNEVNGAIEDIFDAVGKAGKNS